MTFIYFYITLKEAHKALAVIMSEMRKDKWKTVQVTPLDSKLISLFTLIRDQNPDTVDEFKKAVEVRFDRMGIKYSSVQWIPAKTEKDKNG